MCPGGKVKGDNKQNSPPPLLGLIVNKLTLSNRSNDDNHENTESTAKQLLEDVSGTGTTIHSHKGKHNTRLAQVSADCYYFLPLSISLLTQGAGNSQVNSSGLTAKLTQNLPVSSDAKKQLST